MSLNYARLNAATLSAFAGDSSGTAVTITKGAASVSAIPETEFVDPFGQQQGTRTTYWSDSSDLSEAGIVANAAVSIGPSSFNVLEVQSDDGGMSMVVLEAL